MESANSGGAASYRDSVDKVTINIGATSYLLGNRQPTRTLGAVNPEYFSEGEGADFVAFIHEQSITLGLSIESEQPVVGMWQGNLEPALSVDVVGLPTQVERLARLLGRRYNQESVMLFQPDPKGRGNLYSITDVSADEADLVFGEMLRQGLPGGRYMAGRIEIVDVAGESGSNVRALADLLGKEVRTIAGHTRFLSKGEGDY
ncbi:MAG: hypothetical protein DLM69_11110 [Candidatus Chloroheliales bacterium]|nr:MAG: hypothetical protein DLM69_11110 [Chloroflexota bacterium]